ncbi:MAG TPA: DUF6006 family protein [Allosphingosinicella sp.]|jgi:hypothetical protein
MRIQWLLTAALLAATAPATASTVPGGWFIGDWRCTLDGRQTRMTWRIVSVDYGRTDGEVGTSVAGAEYRGRFMDGGTWTDLTYGRATSTTLNFRHSDGNAWFLRRISATQARGNSTWNGRPYPLSCTKTR